MKETMKYKFTTQSVIDMGVHLYENAGFTREQILMWLTALVENGYADVNIDSMFDLIVG